MRSSLVMATALTALVLTGCASYGVEDWGDRLDVPEAAIKIGPGERKLIHTPPGTNRQVWSVLLLLDAAQGAYIRYGETGQTSDRIETGGTPNYIRVRTPGGAGIHVENPKDNPEASATLVVQWREYVD